MGEAAAHGFRELAGQVFEGGQKPRGEFFLGVLMGIHGGVMD